MEKFDSESSKDPARGYRSVRNRRMKLFAPLVLSTIAVIAVIVIMKPNMGTQARQGNVEPSETNTSAQFRIEVSSVPSLAVNGPAATVGLRPANTDELSPPDSVLSLLTEDLGVILTKIDAAQVDAAVAAAAPNAYKTSAPQGRVIENPAY